MAFFSHDIALLVPSTKGLQRLLDVSYTEGCDTDNDILFYRLRSQIMFFG